MDDRIERDDDKVRLCALANVSLVTVPYWWDRSESQLISFIRYVKPDFLSSLPELSYPQPISPSIPRSNSAVEGGKCVNH